MILVSIWIWILTEDLKVTYKRILKIFQRSTPTGDILYEGREEAIRHDDDHISKVKNEVFATCPSCEQVIEKNRFRYRCPICGGICCDFCHQAREDYDDKIFNRSMLVERELEKRWEILENVPGLRWSRKVSAFNSVGRLRRLLYDRRNAQRRLPPGR
jgi:predicted RNA-binding Zn-ribbon protein involved in translation (DUF1610 family)